MKTKKEKTGTDGSMSLTDHLKEMRNRLVVCLIVFLIGAVVCFTYSAKIIEAFTNLGSPVGYSFVAIGPSEKLMVYFNTSLIASLVIAVPVIAYEIFNFCSPGLKPKEKSFALFGMVFGSIFFVIGVIFAYKITLPFMLRFLITFGGESIIEAQISIEKYVSFLLTIFVIFGVIFELPVLSVILTMLGIIKPKWLVSARKVMIVLIFVIAAIITPPDPTSQIMVAIPILLLYELSILLSKVVYKFKKEPVKPENEDGEEDDEEE